MVDWVTPQEVEGASQDDVDRANRAIDYLISGALYDAAPDGGPSNPQQRKACQDAARLQAVHLREGLDEGGSVSLGSLSLSGASSTGSGSGSAYSVDAVRILRAAGLSWKVR